MADVIFEEIECKSAVSRVSQASARMLPFRWTLNPYRGWRQACTYCVARDGHDHPGHGAGGDSDTRVIVKVNAPEMLRQDLGRASWQRELIAIGTACDPYQAAELKYSLTHRILKVLRDFANPASIVTKSPNVIRDADVLEELSAVTDITVSFGIPTLDEDVWGRIEPGTATPHERLDAIRVLSERGIRCGVMLAPLLPGLTDDPASLEEVVEAARERGASFMHDNVLYLKPGTKEWSMPFLREAYPHLSERYSRYYRGPYASKSYTHDVHRIVDRLRLKYDMVAPRREQPSAGQLQLAM
jgi:DNA repair photolyase